MKASFTLLLTVVSVLISLAFSTERYGWSVWQPCPRGVDCTRQRFQRCSSLGRNLTSSLCVDQGQPFYEEISGSVDCTDQCPNEVSRTETLCIGECYDASLTRIRVCSSGSCMLTSMHRCYDPLFCSASWVRFGQPSLCSRSCGGGTIQQPLRCFLDPLGSRLSSHNCRGTDMNVTAIIYSTLPCNSHACPTWTTWVSAECSTSCGLGRRIRRRECSYLNRQSALCTGRSQIRGIELCDAGQCNSDATINASSTLRGTTSTRPSSSPNNNNNSNNVITPSVEFAWSEWSRCSSLCSNHSGTRIRERSCAVLSNQLTCPYISPQVEACTSDELCTECHRDVPCHEWGEWKIAENCSTNNEFLFQRDCNTEWRLELTLKSCPNHQYLRREPCQINENSSISQLHLIIIVVVVALAIIIIVGIISSICVWTKRKLRKESSPTENDNNSEHDSGDITIQNRPVPLPRTPRHREALQPLTSSVTEGYNEVQPARSYEERVYEVAEYEPVEHSKNTIACDVSSSTYLTIHGPGTETEPGYILPNMIRAPYPITRPRTITTGETDRQTSEPGYVVAAL